MKLIAHRGNYLSICENKINCCISSYKLLDGIEIDVRMTKDNIFVLKHNSLHYSDLNIYCISKTNYNNLKIDKLDTLLDNLHKLNLKNKIVMIDMKCNSNEKKYAKYLIKLLKKYNDLSFLLCSFNYTLLKYIKKKSIYNCGLIIGYHLNLKKDYKLFDFISIHKDLVDNYNYPNYIWGKNVNKININTLGKIIDK